MTPDRVPPSVPPPGARRDILTDMERSVAPKTRRRLCLEQLEDRLTPTTTAVPWPNANHLTLSFAPDGTSTGQLSSSLFQNLNGVTSTSAWQLAILAAYQTWAVNSNINLSVVNDGGQAFGTAGVPEGDSRFGDIRVGMASLANTALANTAPFTWTGTTWSGDTLLNSNYNFSVNGKGSGYDLFSVMLHEAGLAFGLPDQGTNPASVMYNQYQGVFSGLTPADVAAFQALYGTRTPDAFQGSTGDNTFATAYSFLALPASGLTFQADLGRMGEAEFYKFTAPVLTTGLTIDLTTSGLSSLTANLQVYNANHQLLGATKSVNPLNGDLTLSVPGSILGGTYYIEVSGATNSVFDVGSYQLSVGVSTILGISLPKTTYTAPISLSNPGSVLGAVLSLLPKWTNPSSLAFNVSTYSQLSFAGQQNWFYVPSPPTSTYGSGPQVMVAEAWGTSGTNPLHPEVLVYSGGLFPQLLSSQVLTNDQGVFTIQLPNAASTNGYYVVVESSATSGAGSTGQYFLGVNFHSSPAEVLSQLATGTLNQATSQEFSQLTVNQNELWHFNLSASTGGANPAEEVQMQIYDQSGNLLFSLTSYADQPPTTGDVYLLAGTYTVRYSAVAQDPNDLAAISFALTGENLSYPMSAMATSAGGNHAAPTYSTSQPTSTSSGGGTYSPPVYS